MGTGAVYVTLSGLKGHPGPLTKIETVFFFINVSLFILNSSTLLIQALRAIFFSLGIFTVLVHAYLVYPQQSRRLINDPVKGVFVPLIVRTNTTPYVSQTQCHTTGVVIRDHCNRNYQLRSYTGPYFR